MRSILLLTTLFCVIYACEEIAFHPRSTAWSVGQTVQTTSGPVNGHAALNATAVSEYLGIPFAQPPIGNLRFESPKPYISTSLINGTSFGFTCPTRAIGMGTLPSNLPTILASISVTPYGTRFLEELLEFSPDYNFSEDCLTLNVWTKPQSGDEKKAVLVWIYGGSFTSGSTTNPIYNGQYLADTEDVVVVTVNYRLSILGFPGSPATPNLGLMDQRLAVEWVRDNIAAFGGDPSRITLAGQSAGSGSVDAYSWAYASDPIVQAFICESGNVATSQTIKTADTASALFYNVSTTVGCGGSTSISTDVLECMKKKDYSSLLAAIPPTTSTTGNSGFAPTVDNILIFGDYLTLAAAGSFIKKPMLVGNNNNEPSIFSLLGELTGQPSASAATVQLFENTFSCGAATRANISAAWNVPIWRYWYFGDFPNMRIQSQPDSGAYHGSEIALIWNTGTFSPQPAGVPAPTPAEVNLASYMRKAWTTFVKDPVNGLSAYGWPKYDPSQNTLIRLAYNNQTGPNLASPAAYDSMCNATFPLSGTSNGTGPESSNFTSTSNPVPTATSSAATANVGNLTWVLAMGILFWIF